MGLAFKRFATSLVRWLLLIGSVCAHQHMYFDAQGKDAESIALWLFDEQLGLYPSCVLGDAASNNIPPVLGPGGHLVEGQFGNALQLTEPPGANNPLEEHLVGLAARQQLAVNRPDAAPSMTWQNNGFCALMTRGEKHLRQEVEFASPTQTAINHAHSDWTIEFCFKLNDKPGEQDGVIFEIGEGPRSADTDVTLLLLAQDQASSTEVQ